MTNSLRYNEMLSYDHCRFPDIPTQHFPRKFVNNDAYEANSELSHPARAGNPFAAVQLFTINR
jgi:hypothetical protein